MEKWKVEMFKSGRVEERLTLSSPFLAIPDRLIVSGAAGFLDLALKTRETILLDAVESSCSEVVLAEVLIDCRIRLTIFLLQTKTTKTKKPWKEA